MRNYNKILLQQLGSHFNGEENIPPDLHDFFLSISNQYDDFEKTIQQHHLKRQQELVIQSELLRSNNELQSFVGTVSHDLKAPLRTIGSFAQLLSQHLRKNMDEETKEYINFIVGGTQSMNQLIEDMRKYAKAGSVKEKPISTDLNIALDKVLKDLNAVILESKAQIICINPLPTIVTYPGFIHQLFQNLIGNAIKFRSQEIPEIRINSFNKEGKELITISDNGRGIPEDEQKNAFTAFKRLSSSKNTKGSGLGLNICKKIVDMLGGKIWLESEVGKGTTFFFTLVNHVDKTNEKTIENKISQYS